MLMLFSADAIYADASDFFSNAWTKVLNQNYVLLL